MLRRRKAAALMIQSVFRGFLQRKRWRVIIRLKTSWGNTRILAHALSVWRGQIALIQRLRAFARRLRNRSKAKTLNAFFFFVAEKKRRQEELLRRRMRRTSAGIRLRVFEGWLGYTETSLAVGRLRLRSLVRPVFREWRKIATEDRARSQLQWACAVLASRTLRWKERSRYVRSRKSCTSIQVMARTWIASARIKARLKAVRFRRAEEAVQVLEVRSTGPLFEPCA